MSEFFQSEVVRAEMAEVAELQEEVYNNVFKFPSMTTADQKYHVDILERLIEKQKIIYTRLSLSDDPEAKQMKKNLERGSKELGFGDADLGTIFKNMRTTLDAMQQSLRR